MNNSHDLIKHVKFFRQALSQDKKPIAFFLSAGCPLAVSMQEGRWPLIPDVKGLTESIYNELKSKECDIAKSKYDNLLSELAKANGENNNIEDILSFIRGLKEVATGSEVRGFSKDSLIELEESICCSIAKKLDVNLPDDQSPYHKLASWISSIHREKPLEIFTTNYDLLMEQAFEDVSVPYFDGFVGSRQSFFDLRALEDNLIPNHWTRLWKIHGSINWFQKENKEVYRSSYTQKHENETTKISHLIYPSHLKYEQSRKMPYLALIDQLTRFIRQQSSLLILSGYSFNDEHLNDTIINALKSNPNAMVIALLFGKLESYSTKSLSLALHRSNLAFWGEDEAIIGTVRGKWVNHQQYDDSCQAITEYAIKKTYRRARTIPNKPTSDSFIDTDIMVHDGIAYFLHSKTREVTELKLNNPDEKIDENNINKILELVTSDYSTSQGLKLEYEYEYELQLGDFAKLGNFLQFLVGDNQIRTDNEK